MDLRAPLPLDPLVAEAKRRAWRRRLLLAGIVLVAGAVVGTLILRSSDRPRPVTAAAPACRAAQLHLAGGGGGAAGGTKMEDFNLTNVSLASCTLQGWPSVQLVLRSGRVITPRLRRFHYYSSGVPNHPLDARAIRLSPSHAATFIAFNRDFGDGCALVRTMLVTPPGSDRTLSVPNGIGIYCPPLEVSPLVPGRSAKMP
jgi:Domain of unknown function (DUF4232)